MRKNVWTAASVASLAVIASCSANGSSSTSSTGPTGTAAAIVKASGDSQSAQYKAAVPKPLTVKVTDAAGAPVQDAPVAWAIQLTGQPQALQASATNASGETQIAPILNGLPGAFTVTAGINNHSVTFSGSANVGLASVSRASRAVSSQAVGSHPKEPRIAGGPASWTNLETGRPVQ